MDNFDLRKYLKNNPLLTEGQFSWFTQDTDQQIGSERENTITVYMHDNQGNSWKEDNYEGYGEFGGMDYYELLDKMNGGIGDRSEGIRKAFDSTLKGKVLFPALTVNSNLSPSHDFTQEAERDPNQSWYSSEYEDEDDYDEEDYDDEYELEEGKETVNEAVTDEFGDDLAKIGNALAGEIEDELEKHEKELNEAAGIIGILGWILLSNTVANMLSKLAKKLSAKYNWGKGEEAAKKIYDFTHKNEEAFKTPIRRVVGLFTKNEKWKRIISDVLYAILIFMMSGQAGGDAVKYIKNAGYLKGGIYSLKSLVKGTEVATILKGAVTDAVS